MLLYESHHFDFISNYDSTNLNFPSHLHRCFELIFVVGGEMDVMIEQKNFHLHTGQYLLILPNEIHSIATVSQSRAKICIFSPDYVTTFQSMIENRSLENPVFDLSVQAKMLVSKTLFKDDFNLLEQKASLYLLLAELMAQTTLIKTEKKDSALLHTLLTYIQEHFTEPITLQSIAVKLGYSYNYLSKYFNAHVKTSFTEFLNDTRISYGCHLLRTTEKNITEIAYLCGYENIRSFNRNFIKKTLCTPKEYRHTLPGLLVGQQPIHNKNPERN
ncbi:AraC family transcriptional regulator [Niallia taxi]|uniref:helix-turn-helix domain-containing protein n=1 Tax=Niallia taxi TaxID=2499688 RepID=UPI0011A0483C|nr:AraC family transcriptional regulator [Niallia taxi]MCT2345447.1 AraC family transcriptional regulator [Niallia taxi]MDE5052795.1 AraC family transcriptional regulator [Niallia taxi]MED3963163.1 AraC family transcriptional regulator [Niallia taxi]